MARPTPVLPLVGSMSVPPGLSRPSRSAASIRDTATRSLIEPPGFIASIFARICGLTPAARRERRTSGVFPMGATMEALIPIAMSTSRLIATQEDTFRRPGSARASLRRRSRRSREVGADDQVIAGAQRRVPAREPRAVVMTVHDIEHGVRSPAGGEKAGRSRARTSPGEHACGAVADDAEELAA